MFVRYALTVVVFAVLCFALRSPLASAQDPKGDAASEFQGKFLKIIRKSETEYATDLHKVQVKQLGGKSFLVGIGADVPDSWQKGMVVWLAVDDIAEITVFSTLEELRRPSSEERSKKEIPQQK